MRLLGRDRRVQQMMRATENECEIKERTFVFGLRCLPPRLFLSLPLVLALFLLGWEVGLRDVYFVFLLVRLGAFSFLVWWESCARV